MVATSLKAEADVFTFPPQWIPSPVRWANYTEAAAASHILAVTLVSAS
ncbi:hypothetical protein BH20ACT8_BH20ACT8_13440 [soil metagenome]